MIIRDPKPEFGCFDTVHEGDKTIFKHYEWVEPVYDAVDKYRRFSDNGFTDGRDFQLIAKVPFFEDLRMTKLHGPDWKDNENLMRQWLASPIGERCRVASDTGKTRYLNGLA